MTHGVGHRIESQHAPLAVDLTSDAESNGSLHEAPEQTVEPATAQLKREERGPVLRRLKQGWRVDDVLIGNVVEFRCGGGPGDGSRGDHTIHTGGDYRQQTKLIDDTHTREAIHFADHAEATAVKSSCRAFDELANVYAERPELEAMRNRDLLEIGRCAEPDFVPFRNERGT